MAVKSKLSLKGKPKCVSIVEALVFDPKGNLLLLKRSKSNSLYIGKWQLPGGKVEPKESIKRAIKREIKEETGCACNSIKLKKKVKFVEKFRGKVSTVCLSVFVCKLKGDIILSEDHCEKKFVDITTVSRSSLAPVSKKAIFD